MSRLDPGCSLASVERGEPSAQIRERVIKARRVQHARFHASPKVTCNAVMRSKDIAKHCKLEQEAQDLLKMAMTDLNFSARAYDRILKVARTIADLSDSETIQTAHISEAIQYRALDRQWQL